MTPTTYGRDFAYCLKSHGGVRGFNASLWRFLLRCTLFCHSVATFLTSVSSYEGGCGFEVYKNMLSYSLWDFIGSFCANGNNQGLNILINLFFGVAVNAARMIAYQVDNAILTFSTNFMTSIQPQIVKSYAAHNKKDFFS